jgi:hypothetical protein
MTSRCLLWRGRRKGAAMKNRLTEDRAMVGMRRGELSWRRQRSFHHT